MSLAKIGQHVISGHRKPLGKPRIIKLLDPSPEYLAEVRGLVGSMCTIVVRYSLRGTALEGQPLDAPISRAEEWYALCRPRMVDALALYEGYNEIGKEQASAFALFESARLRLMHGGNRRCAVGSWGAGRPDFPEWSIFEPALRDMRPDDAVALHEYYVDAADISNRYHIGRYRMVPQLAGKAKVITELGRDTVEGRGYPGYRLDPACSDDQYLAELRAVGNVYEQDADVIGAVVFATGDISDPKWIPFDANSIAATLAAEGSQAAIAAPPELDGSARRLVIELARPLALTPATNVVTQWFGATGIAYPGMAGHNGLDYRAPRGSRVLAANPGIVHLGDQGTAGLGIYVKVVYYDGRGVARYETRYAHLSEWKAQEGRGIARGETLGLSGNTGNSTGDHLHWDLRVYGMSNPAYGDRIDPAPFRTL